VEKDIKNLAKTLHDNGFTSESKRVYLLLKLATCPAPPESYDPSRPGEGMGTWTDSGDYCTVPGALEVSKSGLDNNSEIMVKYNEIAKYIARHKILTGAGAKEWKTILKIYLKQLKKCDEKEWPDNCRTWLSNAEENLRTHSISVNYESLRRELGKWDDAAIESVRLELCNRKDDFLTYVDGINADAPNSIRGGHIDFLRKLRRC